MFKRKRKALTVITGLLVLWVVVGTIYWTGKYSGMQQSPAPQTTTAPVPAPKHPNVPELFVDVNNERVKAGEQPLVEDPRLDASAAAKCSDEVINHYHAHISPTGVTWQSFFSPALQHNHIGENLSWDYPDSQSVVNGWMGSPLHRANILDRTFTKVGYATCDDEVVQHFQG